MNVAIVVAGGKGKRFGGPRPKQFLALNGIPIIIHTLGKFERSQTIESVIVVLPAEETAGFESLAKQFALDKVTRIVSGGETRAQSVAQGLAAIQAAEIVAVHDGVRPLVAVEEIDAVVRRAALDGAAVLVADIRDTVKRVKDERIVGTLPRLDLCRALTPQCFRLDILRRAYARLSTLESVGVEVTDDSFLVEQLGVEIAAVPGSAANIKITNEEDLRLAESLISGK
jgi:2-C-methyl-D-erythritol 4-phosphate cytidylyltransferase